MQVIKITVNVDRDPWEDLAELEKQDKLLTAMADEAGSIRVGALPHGMQSGRTSVAIAVPLPDGRIVLTETSLALFLAAADALRAAYPNG